MRSALAALVTTVMLAAGCSDEGPSVTYPDGPGTTSESAKPVPARLHWDVTEPVIASYLGIYTTEDAEEVWDLAVDLVKKWHINPQLLQTRRYLPRELYPVARNMAPKLARQWRSDVRRAIRGIDRGGASIDHVSLFNIFSLVVWNLPTPADGAWRNPMVSEPTIEGAVLPAVEGLRVDINVTANFRVDRGTEDALQPYSTVLRLYYRLHEDEDADDPEDTEWLLEIYSGRWKIGQEIPDKPKKKKRPDNDVDETPSGTATSDA
jgi:hypothetical protein